MESELIQGLIKSVEKLQEEVKLLKTQRVTQAMYIPDSVKQRTVGEGPRFIRGGIAGDKPTLGEEPPQSSAVYFDITNNYFYVWNSRTATWVKVTLS